MASNGVFVNNRLFSVILYEEKKNDLFIVPFILGGVSRPKIPH